MLAEALEHSAIESLKLMPFLFLTYLLVEYVEHKINRNYKYQLQGLGKYGPLFGAVAGIFPQCGFSAAASGLYIGRVITLGTLLSVYLATSDEMLPILIARAASPSLILRILLLKVLVGVISGILVDFFFRKTHQKTAVPDDCGHAHCGCGKDGNIVLGALRHSVSILLYLFLITAVLNYFMLFGEGRLSGSLLNRPFIGEALAGLIGLIPNCASSVFLTELYLEGGITFSSMMSGLFVSAGAGLLVLLRENKGRWKENLQIIGLLYGIGVVAGWLL